MTINSGKHCRLRLFAVTVSSTRSQFPNRVQVTLLDGCEHLGVAASKVALRDGQFVYRHGVSTAAGDGQQGNQNQNSLTTSTHAFCLTMPYTA